MRRTFARCAILALMVGLFVSPLTVFAQPAASIEPISSATLTNKVGVSVPITATCGPLIDSFSGATISGFLDATVTQAAGGHTVAQASGFGLILCDGLPHTIKMSMVATNVPFHPGPKAFVSASLRACGTDPVTGMSVCLSGSTSGPLRLSN